MSAAVEAVTTALNEAIKSNKLSSSRVDRIKTLSLATLHDPSFASTILRVHLKAPSSHKLTSFYIFDAVARQARDVVRKNGAGFDVSGAQPPEDDGTGEASDERPQPGTPAALVSGAKAFLSFLDGVAEEVTESTFRAVQPEHREKVRKVIDIWMKANTFGQDLLEDITTKLNSVEVKLDQARIAKDHSRGSRSKTQSEGEVGKSSLGSPGMAALADDTAATTPPLATPVAVPANLLALLGAAVGTSSAPVAVAPLVSQPDVMSSINSLLAQAQAAVTTSSSR
ncbi:unnamed protein product [Tilletia caries]|nr:unnamed protein product [Tilletia controversa]CAD6958030.1 unnamed protein product [Tilletia caries]CAD7068443.1 unnamed protein product [Tilletia caries]